MPFNLLQFCPSVLPLVFAVSLKGQVRGSEHAR